MDIFVRFWQDLGGKSLTKILQNFRQEFQDVMVRSYQDRHVSKKNPTKNLKMARHFCCELLKATFIEKI